MKNALVSAIVAALVAGGTGAAAASRWINGSAIKPGTIRISRLTPGAIAKLKGDTGPQGPQGEPGPAGPAGASAPSYRRAYICIKADGTVTFGGYDASGLVTLPNGQRIGVMGHEPNCGATDTVEEVLLP